MMLRHLTRAERWIRCFTLALVLATTPTLGCSVELVGVDRAVVEVVDARAAEPDARAAADAQAVALDAHDVALMSVPDAARDPSSDALPPREAAMSSTPSVCGDAAALPQWTDPERPAQLPGQFVDTRSSCPAIEPVAGISCSREGQQCDYPVCWGRGQRSWVCVQETFQLWLDESFLCAASRPCPDLLPKQGDVCCLQIECVYPTYCCKGPSGFQAALCDGHWRVTEPGCGLCPTTP